MNRGWGGGLLFVFRGDGSRAQKLENRWNCLNSFVRGCRAHNLRPSEQTENILAASLNQTEETLARSNSLELNISRIMEICT